MNWLKQINLLRNSLIQKTTKILIKLTNLLLKSKCFVFEKIIGLPKAQIALLKPFSLLFKPIGKNYRFESLRKPHLNALVWIFMSAILISKVIHSQITNRQEWIIQGIIECTEFDHSDSQFVSKLSASHQKKIWNKNSNARFDTRVNTTKPLSPEDTFYLNHPLLVTKNKSNHTTTNQIHHVDLNNCDSILLESLPRIGPVTASKIIRYRERLGGYVSPFQLMEIYRIDSLILQIPSVQFHTNNYQKQILKIPRSGLTVKDLYRHPYIGKANANWLWKYLQAHPKLSVEEFKNSSFLTINEKTRLIPYLDFNSRGQ
jgi:DNA uptake protein ComE-like DNA-binding protein